MLVGLRATSGTSRCRRRRPAPTVVTSGYLAESSRDRLPRRRSARAASASSPGSGQTGGAPPGGGDDDAADVTPGRSPSCQATSRPGNSLVAAGVAPVGYHGTRRPTWFLTAEEHDHAHRHRPVSRRPPGRPRHRPAVAARGPAVGRGRSWPAPGPALAAADAAPLAAPRLPQPPGPA